jgi:predicted 3-demethylubiquinone-9 3-methyltransferase (glyoxalase superfamily)
MQKISPYLWFDTEAEQAARLYVSLFDDSRIVTSLDGGPVLMVKFLLAGVEFLALNGGPRFPFTEAISMFVHAETQEEIDRLWNALVADGGAPSQCGWLKDRFGLSWQIVPPMLTELLGDPDREKAHRVMQAMLQMTKIDIQQLHAAAAAAAE